MMHDSTATRRRAIVSPLIRLVINAAIPVLVYLLVRPHVRSDLTALVIGAAIPIASAPARPRSWPCPGR